MRRCRGKDTSVESAWHGACSSKTQMATKYFGVVKDNAYATRFMLSPTVKFEAPRDSKKLAAQAHVAFVALLARTAPHAGATAWFERSDRYGSTTLVRYSGKPTAWNDRGGAIHGRWFLEIDVEGSTFPQIVDA